MTFLIANSLHVQDMTTQILLILVYYTCLLFLSSHLSFSPSLLFLFPFCLSLILNLTLFIYLSFFSLLIYIYHFLYLSLHVYCLYMLINLNISLSFTHTMKYHSIFRHDVYYHNNRTQVIEKNSAEK